MRRPIWILRSVVAPVAVVLGLLVANPAVASAEYVTDGSFETGLSGTSAWSSTSTIFGTSFCDQASCGTAGGPMVPRSGSVFTWFGGTTSAEVGSASQTVTVPAGRPTTLSFWIKAPMPKSGTTLSVSTGGVERWSFVESYPDEDDDADHPWAAYTRIEVPIPGSAFDGTPTTLRFDFVSPGASSAVNYAVDDVSLVADENADASVTLSPTTATALLGDTVTYDVEVANAGPDAADVSVSGALPPELALVSAGGTDLSCTPPASPGDDLVCDAGTIASGDAVTGQIEVRAAAVGTASLTLTSAIAAPAVDTDPANDGATATLQIEPVADLAATIDAPDDATAGVPFDVVVGARNDGPSPTSDVTLTTELPTGVTTDDLPADCAVAGTTVTCDVGALADGADADRTLTVVPGQAGTVQLQTVVAGAEHDPSAANDQITTTVAVAAAPEPPLPPSPEPPPAPTPPVATPEPPVAPVCLSERRFTTRLLRGRSGPGLRINAAPSRARIVSARLTGPKGWKARNAKRAQSTVDVDLRGAPVGRYTLRVRVRIATQGRSKARTVTVTRTYRTCTPGS